MSSNVVVQMNQIGSNAHRLYVQRLYRRSLRLAGDWYWQRSDFREKACVIRAHFDENKRITNPKQVERILAHTEFLLASYYHPQPYISPAAPGGSKWERNIPFPEELIKRGVTPFDNC
ncbi:uncharacterized protein BJ171DRAFT_484898 [Polychytrium aggregatum]|uniref:uncharacterized protein n=1 Tax=Polychytrium aggregatum TaxID=110093 RepID=UPI0022FF268E|nr:uncharacterized protein BJ171DRAFT_484898 [Polychytrium aggregatum]KAI9209750.1 hypothetical protein BJ171DRAFT_484898 [Polychytrium aggregatum]